MAPSPVVAIGPGAPRTDPRKGTLIGIAVPTAGHQSAAPQVLRKNIPKGTMLGVALPGIAPTHPPKEETPPTPPSNAAPSTGGVPPAFHPPPPYEPDPPHEPEPPHARPPHIPSLEGLMERDRTIDDSAIDDGAFAPIFPGADRVSSGGDDAVRTRDLRADSSAPPRADAVTLRVPRGGPSRAVALVAIVGAALGAVAVLVWFATRSKSSVSVRADLRAKGAGVELVVRCDRCQDGTALELLGHKGSFVGGSAALPIGQEVLRAGRNALTTTLTPPNANSREVSFVVDVPFVVRPSLAPLARGESAIDVVFDVTPEVKEVTVDGTPLEIDRKVGRGIWHVKIPPPGDDMRAFKSTVRYAVLVGAAKREGGLEVAVPYAPIHLGLPGRRPLISDDASEVEVTGRTGPNATVRFGVAPDAPDARAVTADKDGLFRGKAPVSKTAVTLEIAAFGAALAPRTIGVPLVRGGVQALRAQVKATFEAIAHAPDAHVGELVDVVFVAARSSEEDGRPFVVGESQCTHPAPSGDRSDRAGADGAGCPAVRVLLPAGVAVAVGQTVEALAVVVRGVPIEKGRSTAVELDASVVVGAHR